MGIYSRDYIREDNPGFLRADQTVIPWLIGVNVALFLLDVGSRHQVSHWLALDLERLWPRPEVWRLLTYGFCHASTGHLFGNMLGLYIFGRYVEPICGPREFLAFYLVGILLAGLTFIALDGTVGLSILVGASGGVIAVTILAAMHFPTVEILLMFVLPIQLRWLALMTVVADLAGFMGGQGGVAHSAHLGGAAFGFLYYRQGWRVLAWLPSFRFRLRLPRKRPPVRIYRPAEEEPVVSEATLDALLAKVSAHGEASLTDEERATLVAASEQAKRRRART